VPRGPAGHEESASQVAEGADAPRSTTRITWSPVSPLEQMVPYVFEVFGTAWNRSRGGEGPPVGGQRNSGDSLPSSAQAVERRFERQWRVRASNWGWFERKAV
jgi:hypothetical protein